MGQSRPAVSAHPFSPHHTLFLGNQAFQRESRWPETCPVSTLELGKYHPHMDDPGQGSSVLYNPNKELLYSPWVLGYYSCVSPMLSYQQAATWCTSCSPYPPRALNKVSWHFKTRNTSLRILRIVSIYINYQHQLRGQNIVWEFCCIRLEASRYLEEKWVCTNVTFQLTFFWLAGDKLL